MAKKAKKLEDVFMQFDVTYEDGSKSSRRKVNVTGLERDDIDAHALTEIMNQDRKIGEMSGKPRGKVKLLERSA
jgi:hypothetical protein